MFCDIKDLEVGNLFFNFFACPSESNPREFYLYLLAAEGGGAKFTKYFKVFRIGKHVSVVHEKIPFEEFLRQSDEAFYNRVSKV